MTDLYPDFETLAENEKADIDYRIRVSNRATPLVVMAPHGGWIEPGSSEIAEAIAQEDYSLYLFEGLRRRPHRELHITSTRFDEPQAVQLVSAAATVITVHGRADGNDSLTVWLGGRHIALRDAIAFSLNTTDFQATTAVQGFAGREANNICNRCMTRTGVQLELPRTLRAQLMHDIGKRQAFSGAIRQVLSSWDTA